MKHNQRKAGYAREKPRELQVAGDCSRRRNLELTQPCFPPFSNRFPFPLIQNFVSFTLQQSQYIREIKKRPDDDSADSLLEETRSQIPLLRPILPLSNLGDQYSVARNDQIPRRLRHRRSGHSERTCRICQSWGANNERNWRETLRGNMLSLRRRSRRDDRRNRMRRNGRRKSRKTRRRERK